MEVDDEDFLIATDIDKLIDILSTRKEVEVGKLSQELRLNRKEVEKWLHVLEEEGVVGLANRMGSLYAVWVMDGAQEEGPQRKKAPPQHASPKRKSESRKPKKEEDGEEGARDEEEVPAAIGLAEEIGAMRSVSQRSGAEPRPKKKSLLSGIFPRRKARKKSGRASAQHISEDLPPEEAPKEAHREPPPRARAEEPDDFGDGLLPLEESPEEDFPRVIEEAPQAVEEQFSPPGRRSPATAAPPAPAAMLREEPAERMKRRLEKTEFLKLPRSQTGKLRARLEDYLMLIRKSKNELRSLESEKDTIHREGFLSLEKDFEANLDSLEYALLEKEKRILEARERVSILPDKIGSLHEIHESLRGFDSDARELLSKTKKDLDSSWGRLQQVSDELSGELSKGEEEALYERGRMMQLRDMLASVSHAEEQLKETLANSRAAMAEMEEKVSSVEESLSELAGSRSLLNERLEQVRSGLDEKMRRLDDLRTEMEKIDKVESWFREYSEDYESKMDELQSYVKESEEELSHIKKAAELEYVKRYLSELDSAEGKYRENLGALEMEEASVDEKISEVRERIKQLMRESSELMSKYRQMTEEGPGFGEMVATARSRSRSQRRTLEEKASQRRKQPPPASRKAPARSKPQRRRASRKAPSRRAPSRRSGRKSPGRKKKK